MLAAVMGGCGGDRSAGDAAHLLFPYIAPDSTVVYFEREDSTGVELVRNGEIGAWGAGLLAVEETRVLGAVDGPAELELSGVSALAEDERGELYVASSRSGGISVFDSSGRYRRQIGRKGEGPAEFARISRLRFEGDTLLVTDVNLSRTTALTRAGVHIATWNGYTQPEGWVFVRAAARGGWVAEVRPRSSPDLEAARREVADSLRGSVIQPPPIEVRRFLPESSAVGELLLAIPQPVAYVEPSAERGVRTALFTISPAYAFDGRGHLFVTVSRTTASTSTTPPAATSAPSVVRTNASRSDGRRSSR